MAEDARLRQCSGPYIFMNTESGIVVTKNEIRCFISLESPDERQVVAEFFGMQADCISKSDITIYDGPEGNATFVHSFCQAKPISYISRKRRLQIFYKEDDKDEKPFSLNAYLNVCRQEITGNESISTFRLPLFNGTRTEAVTCAYIVRVRERSLVKLNMTFSRISLMSCSKDFRVFPDGKAAENDTVIYKCEDGYYELEAFYNITIIFMASSGMSLTGNYTVVKLDVDVSTSSSLGKSTIDHVQGNISSKTSADAPLNNLEKEKTNGGGFYVIVVAVALGCLGLIIALVIVLVLLYRRRGNSGQAKAEKDKENTNDLNIYTDNQDYDVMNVKRLHKSPTETNVYGSTSGPSDVYASADQSENDQDSKNVAEYDLQMFGNTYAETTPVLHKIEEKGDLQANEYGHLELGETYEETLTSKQRKAQKYNDNDVNISDEYGHQDFGQYASTTPMTTKRNVETENVYE
ncbi:hypothetical protein FSP39_021278 [Pinctada imbricata]|uniref:CUB domain-containing protein n=1 Tax=Pinctada imbricata TaxID=66713 RepID=A0AA88YR36_PINIB|nr:hypothetical protein FSP39_021278 [Pinctada imbricata]